MNLFKKLNISPSTAYLKQYTNSFNINHLFYYYKTAIFTCIFLMIVLCNSDSCNASSKFNIFAVQHQDFDSYTHAYKGFVEGIQESEIKDSVKIHNYNARKNLALHDQKIIELDMNNIYDIIFTIGTQSTKRTVEVIKDTPIIFTVVGSPISAGIIDNWKSSGCNVTGIGTPNQVLKGVTQIYELSKFTSIGIIYLKGSPSHEAVFTQIKAMSKKNGVDFYYKGFTLKKDGERLSDNVIKQKIRGSLESVLPKVDAIYIQASGTFTKNFDIFRKMLFKYQVPSFGDPIYIKRGIIVGVGVDNFAFGKQAAGYAVKILKGTKAYDLPMDTGTEFSILVNLEAAEMVNLSPVLLLPIMNSADIIYQRMHE